MTENARTLFELRGLEDRRYSLFSWRTKLALAHKELRAEYRAVRVTDKAAIAFSGQEKVPILIDGDTTVFDSWKIAEYLEARYADRASLFGGEIGRALSRFVNQWVDRQLVPAAGPLVVPDVIACVDEEDGAHLRRQMEKAFGTTLEEMRRQRAERQKVFVRVLEPARATLRGQPFIGGANAAYADYIVFSVFQWARVTSPLELLEPGDPLAAWRERILDLFDGLARREPARRAER